MPAESVRDTLLLVLGPERMLTPAVTRDWFDEELPELDEDEPEDEEPEELLEPLELEELPEPEELLDPEDELEDTLRYSPQTQPVLPLTRT